MLAFLHSLVNVTGAGEESGGCYGLWSGFGGAFSDVMGSTLWKFS
jgi:hypothetical protein